MAGAVKLERAQSRQSLLAAVYTSKQNSRIILLVKQAQGEPVELSRAWRGSAPPTTPRFSKLAPSPPRSPL